MVHSAGTIRAFLPGRLKIIVEHVRVDVGSIRPRDGVAFDLEGTEEGRSDTGEVRLFNLKPYLRGSLFEPLKDENLFVQVQIEKGFGGLIRPNGADLCADMLQMNSRPVPA